MVKNKKKLIGIGAGGHTKMIVDILNDNNNYKLIGLIDKQDGDNYLNIPIIGSDKDLKHLIKSVKNIFIGIADLNNAKKNKGIFNKIKKLGYNVINVFHKTAIISKTSYYGEGIKVFAGGIINSGSTIESNVLVNTGSIIEHDCHICSHAQIAPGAVLGGNVYVGEGSIVGMGARVIQGVKIGKYCMIGAGTIITKDVPNNTIIYNKQKNFYSKWPIK